MELVNKIAYVLVIVGALNWGLYAFGGDVVAYLPDVAATVVYVLIALSALLLLFANMGGGSEESQTQEPMNQGPVDGPNMNM